MQRIMTLFSDIPGLLIQLIVVVFALTVHEVAHGYAAYKLGDPTAKAFGRLSLNPLHHLDPIGFICMFLFGFGWAKPVPINTRYFKKPRQGMAVSALAGPLSNIVLSFLGLILYKTVLAFLGKGLIGFSSEFSLNLVFLILQFLKTFFTLNMYLGIFNLIPLPPLDGSRVMFVLLPDKLYFGIMKYEKYIQIAFLVLLWLDVITVPLDYVCGKVLYSMDRLISLIPFFNF